jgi:hypothetical protein
MDCQAQKNRQRLRTQCFVLVPRPDSASHLPTSTIVHTATDRAVGTQAQIGLTGRSAVDPYDTRGAPPRPPAPGVAGFSSTRGSPPSSAQVRALSAACPDARRGLAGNVIRIEQGAALRMTSLGTTGMDGSRRPASWLPRRPIRRTSGPATTRGAPLPSEADREVSPHEPEEMCHLSDVAHAQSLGHASAPSHHRRRKHRLGISRRLLCMAART